jgi:hypothetical protein
VAATAERRLAAMMAKFAPAIAAQARAALERLDALVPNAVHLVYDNYNALVIAYAAGPKMTDVVCSIALYPSWVTLFFMHGTTLPDPHRLLEGDGKHIRSIRLVDGAAMLDRPAVTALVRATVARVTWDPDAPARTEIRAVVAKQRPRRAPKQAPKRRR